MFPCRQSSLGQAPFTYPKSLCFFHKCSFTLSAREYPAPWLFRHPAIGQTKRLCAKLWMDLSWRPRSHSRLKDWLQWPHWKRVRGCNWVEIFMSEVADTVLEIEGACESCQHDWVESGDAEWEEKFSRLSNVASRSKSNVAWLVASTSAQVLSDTEPLRPHSQALLVTSCSQFPVTDDVEGGDDQCTGAALSTSKFSVDRTMLDWVDSMVRGRLK